MKLEFTPHDTLRREYLLYITGEVTAQKGFPTDEEIAGFWLSKISLIEKEYEMNLEESPWAKAFAAMIEKETLEKVRKDIKDGAPWLFANDGTLMLQMFDDAYALSRGIELK